MPGNLTMGALKQAVAERLMAWSKLADLPLAEHRGAPSPGDQTANATLRRVNE